nr:YheV family putative zinc ribbon protein [Endozoicomonas arenosclerae]
MTTKRFIAGAVCPSCGHQDSVRMFSENGENFRECVDCGFSDVMEKDPSLAGKPPVTRVSPEDMKSKDDADKDNGVQIVRILDQQP